MAENLGKKMRGMATKLIKKKTGSEVKDWEIGSLTSIGEMKLEVSEVDITTLDSPDGAKEYMAGDVTVSDFTVAGNIKKKDDEDTVIKLQELFKNGNTEHFTIQFPSGAKWEFDAFVKSFSTKEVTTEGIIGFDVTFKISGNPVYTKSV